jgi:hypothetical protein
VLQIIIKQEKTKGSYFSYHVSENDRVKLSSRFEAITTNDLYSEINKLIERFKMNKSYKIGVTDSQKIQAILTGENELTNDMLQF